MHTTIFPGSTYLPTQGENAITHAPWAFKKGDQVFENYGQPNHIYFQYHGFSLEDNTHDCVSVPVSVKSSDPDYEVMLSPLPRHSVPCSPLLTAVHTHTHTTLHTHTVQGGVSEACRLPAPQHQDLHPRRQPRVYCASLV